jgi:hypothetical protein
MSRFMAGSFGEPGLGNWVIEKPSTLDQPFAGVPHPSRSLRRVGFSLDKKVCRDRRKQNPYR